MMSSSVSPRSNRTIFMETSPLSALRRHLRRRTITELSENGPPLLKRRATPSAWLLWRRCGSGSASVPAHHRQIACASSAIVRNWDSQELKPLQLQDSGKLARSDIIQCAAVLSLPEQGLLMRLLFLNHQTILLDR